LAWAQQLSLQIALKVKHGMTRTIQDIQHTSGQLRLLYLASIGAAIAVGLLIPIGLSTVFSDRIMLMLAAIGGAILLIVSVRFPVTIVFAIIVYESLLSWQDSSQIQLLGYNRLLFYAVMVSGFGLAFAYGLLLRKRRILLHWIDVALILYLAANLLAVFTSVDKSAARSGLTYLLGSALCLYTTRLIVHNEKHARQILFFLLVFMAFEGLLGGIQYATGSGILYVTAESGGDFLPRATGTLGNGLGWYLSIGYIIAFNLWLYSPNRRTTFVYGIILALIIIGLAASNTRGSWVDCAIATLLSIIPALKMQRRKVIAVLLIAGISSVAVLSTNVLRQRVASIAAQINQPASTTFGFRLTVWQAALQMFEAKPLLGVGQDNFKILLPDYVDQSASLALRIDATTSYNVHHAGLQILAETGLLGAVTFALFALAYLVEAVKVRRQTWETDKGLGMALLVFAVMSILAMIYGGYAFGGYTQVGRIYFIMVGLTIALADINRRRKIVQQP
jgi:O-antigen ligase